MDSLSTQVLVSALHGIIAQLEDLNREAQRTRRTLETIADALATSRTPQESCYADTNPANEI